MSMLWLPLAKIIIKCSVNSWIFSSKENFNSFGCWIEIKVLYYFYRKEAK